MKRQSAKVVGAIAVVAIAPWIIASSASSEIDSNATRVMITGIGAAQQNTRLITMQAGVTSFATSAKRAWEDNAGAMEDLRAELRRYGIEEKDVRTTGLSLSPETEYENGKRQIKGFNVRHSLTVVFRDIDRTGAVLDALVEAGAKEIHGPSFSWEAGDQALAVARADAIRDANDRAHFYAKALGLRVKRVVTMHDGGGYASGQPAAIRTYNEESGGTKVSEGEDTVRVSIRGEYELVR